MRGTGSIPLFLWMFVAISACSDDGATTKPASAVQAPAALVVVDLAAWVDPMIGTGGSGNVLPGALVPHGMVRASPDTADAPGAIAAYHHGAAELSGFSHTHLLGPGGSNNGYSQVLVMPFVGPIAATLPAHRAPFSHDSEVASPGYYAVTLADSQVRVELTATAHAAVHRWTFPPAQEAGLLLDLASSNGKAEESFVERLDATTVRGWARYNVHPLVSSLLDGSKTGDSIVYFHAVFDHSIVAAGAIGHGVVLVPDANPAKGETVGAWLGFGAAPGVVTMRIGISLLDLGQAATNLAAEVGDDDFDAVHTRARAAWNAALSRVKVELPSDSAVDSASAAADDATRRIFYTALWRPRGSSPSRCRKTLQVWPKCLVVPTPWWPSSTRSSATRRPAQTRQAIA